MIQLENEVWQPIPGTRSALIYPFIRKPSITGSNTYIIRSGTHLLVIDPGAVQDQMEKIRLVLSDAVSGPDHPILLIAGHIHVDHMYLGLSDRQLRKIGRIIIAAEDWGAYQLEAADTYWSGADIVGLPQPVARVELHLLTPEDKAATTLRSVPIPESDNIYLRSLQIPLDNRVFYGQSMELSDGDHIEFWSTPGHSRDSLTIRIGSILHVGDIPFALNMGIAGRPGWDREELLTSIRNIRDHLLKEEMVCCPGHGRIIDYAGATEMISRMEAEIVQMPDIAEFNVQRMNLAVWHGLDIIEEAHRLFPIIAGRLMALSYHLDELGMETEARALVSVMEHESIDKLLLDFNQFYAEYKDGKKVKPEVMLKALQVFEKILQKIPTDSIREFLDNSLIRRITRSFSDFLTTVQGTIPEGNHESVDLVSLIKEVFSEDREQEVSIDDLIESVDDEAAYNQLLIRRIAHRIHAHHLYYQIELNDETSVLIQADRLRLYDAFIALIEYLVKADTTALQISLTRDQTGMLMILTPKGAAVRYELPFPGSTLREIEYAGGEVQSVMEPEKEDIRILFQNS
ncbi:MAG: MBL fold metallo-hydrolase [Methanospirillum sp.]|uniref:MBL fold metallo-hydrolase n=1 Tax=Methanospirillum sp. TaxID=45200 RepID=UPI00236A1E44|nr:MBL fold metallo-hydrolase [Methanospirillum sp.]MDD1728632.1 MBL fold metallo-hydrolase [Methanospirillum sp.]